jgi:tetratricopeptide (TPR) repeat protein
LIRKDYSAAEGFLGKAKQLDDEFFEPHFLMGVLRYQEKNYRGAIPELSRSMDLFPTKQAAAYLSKSYEGIGDAQNAKKYAEMAQ